MVGPTPGNPLNVPFKNGLLNYFDLIYGEDFLLQLYVTFKILFIYLYSFRNRIPITTIVIMSI